MNVILIVIPAPEYRSGPPPPMVLGGVDRQRTHLLRTAAAGNRNEAGAP
jgi:hypothetical protein